MAGEKTKKRKVRGARQRNPKGYSKIRTASQKFLDNHPNLADHLDGRPTAYDAQFAIDLIYLGYKGYTQAMAARAIGVSRATLSNWERDHDEFANAMELFRDYRLAHLEGTAIKVMTGKMKGNANLLRFSLMNVDPDNYAGLTIIQKRAKEPNTPPPMDLSAIPIKQRLEILQTFKLAASRHEERIKQDGGILIEGEVIDAEVIEELDGDGERDRKVLDGVSRPRTTKKARVKTKGAEG